MAKWLNDDKTEFGEIKGSQFKATLYGYVYKNETLLVTSEFSIDLAKTVKYM